MMDKLKKFIKQNDVIIDFISKIVFGVFSLILLVIANDLVKDQTRTEKENTAPIFYIEKTNDIKNRENVFKLENKGGKVSHMKFERIDIFTISIGCNKMKYTIYYNNILNESDVNRENVWYFSPSQKYIDTWYFEKNIQKALEKRYQGRSVIVTVPVSYYKISYHDYLNDYKEDYYYGYEDYVSYDFNKSKEITEEDNHEYNSHSFIIANYKSDKELMEQCIKTIIDHYDRYYTEKDIWI